MSALYRLGPALLTIVVLGCAPAPRRPPPPPRTAVPVAPPRPAPAPPPTEDPFSPAPLPPPLPEASRRALAATIDGILDGHPDERHGVRIVGADTGQIVYERNPDVPLTPASNTKLFSSAAALTALGEQARITTRVFGTGSVEGGVLQGDLILLGRHDFSWSTWFYETETVPLDDLAQQLAAAGITRVAGVVRAQGEFLLEGYNFGTYEPASARKTAAERFVTALEDAGIRVGGQATSSELAPPAGATELAQWHSVPLEVACAPVNRQSHNEFADILLRHVGWVEEDTASYAAGAEVVTRLLASGGVATEGLRLFDGSGLSHDNRVTARQITDLFALMDGRPEGDAWRRTFAVAGVHGTLRKRMDGPDTRGRFWGKTGTLSDTIALSGILHHRHDGQRYVVAALMNDIADKKASRAAHDAIVEALARNLRGQAPRPPPPVLQVVRAEAGRIEVRWSPVSRATGYLVERSPDGKRWAREDSRLVTATTHHTMPFGDTVYVRVVTVSPTGESDPSDTYGARVGVAPVLVIDGDDRWEAQPVPENHLGGGHDFVVRYGEALPGAFDSCANEAVTTGLCPLAGRPTTIWSLGEESTTHGALTTDEQRAITGFTDAGGRLVISGAELAFALGEEGSDADTAFLAGTLGATFVADDAETYLLEPVAPSGLPRTLGFFTPDRMVVHYPDQLRPAPGATAWLRYRGGKGGTAAVRSRHGFTLGFPLESIAAVDDRRAILAATLEP